MFGNSFKSAVQRLFDGYGDIISLPLGGSADFDVGFVLNTVTIPL